MIVDQVQTAAHSAFLEDSTGQGVLVCPLDRDDVVGFGDGVHTLHQADWDVMMGRLHRAGFTVAPDEQGEPLHVATLRDGRQVVALVSVTEPFHSDAAADDALGELLERVAALP